MNMWMKILTVAGSISAVSMGGCVTSSSLALPKLATQVDLDRFMGLWYVHGYTPTRLDRNAYNATEKYELDKKGRIRTTYQFRQGSSDGKLKTYRPVGKVVNSDSNAEWKMRFFGVLSASYLILYVDSEYEYTLIGHPNRKMAWLMSREPSIADEDYLELVKELKSREFELNAFVRLPQQWDQPLIP